MSLRSRKIWISVVLVVAFFAIAVLMTSSVNLFSLSDSNVKIEYSDLIRNINASSVAKVLSYKDKLNLINYFYEYQDLKARISSLSYDELNRFLFLGKYLAKYVDPKHLGMSSEVVVDVLNRYNEIANKDVMSGVTSDLGNKANLLKQVIELRNQAEDLYDGNKISKVAYQEIFEKLDDIEYHINLSSFGSKNIELDLNDIARVINKEKASYSINADLLEFAEFERSLNLAQKQMNSVKYISDFVNRSMNSIEQGDISIIGDINRIKTQQFSTIMNNIDSESLGDVLDIIKKGDKKNVDAGDIDFVKTMKLPNITVEGSIEDAWNMNFDVSSLNLKNLLAPMDVSLLSDKSVDNALERITNVKVPGVLQGGIDVPDVLPTFDPGSSAGMPSTKEPIPTTSVDPSNVPDVGPEPSVTVPTTPSEDGSPTDVPSESTMPTESTYPSEDDYGTHAPWYTKINYKVVLKLLVVLIVIVAGTVLVSFKKCNNKIEQEIVHGNRDTFRDKQKIPMSYKERLIELGRDVICRMSAACIKDKRERTPREIVRIFSDKYAGCDRGIIDSFLKYYESALFYRLDVDDSLYKDFVKLCNVIYGILRREEEGIT